MLALYCSSADTWINFLLGVSLGIALTFVSFLLWELHDDRKRERAEFQKWKKQKKQYQSPQVIDAQFVVTSKPQLNNSQALVRRGTSLERRKYADSNQLQ